MLLIRDKGRVLLIREVRYNGSNIGGEKREGEMGVVSGRGMGIRIDKHMELRGWD